MRRVPLCVCVCARVRCFLRGAAVDTIPDMHREWRGFCLTPLNCASHASGNAFLENK